MAQLNNITQAAEQLNFTQPAVTAQIRTLEEHYGVVLFERIGKKLYITEAGRELIKYVEKLLNAYNELNMVMRGFSDVHSSIKVGASTTAAGYILPPALLAFQNCENDDSITVDICSDIPTTVKGLMDNNFDIAIIHSKLNNSQITQFDLSNQNLVWVAKRELVKANDSCQDVRQYPFINFLPGCVYRLKFEDVIKQKEIHPILEYSDAEAIKQAVLDGVGTSILPYVLVESFLADGTLVEFTNEPRLPFVLSIAFRKNKILTPAMRTLLRIFAGQANIESGLLDYLNSES